MSLPHLVNFVSFFAFFLVALWCYVSPSPPLSRFYILKRSKSWQQHNREATQHVERRFPLFYSRVQRAHAHRQVHVSGRIALTSWQEAYTSGFPRQQVYKISNIDPHSVEKWECWKDTYRLQTRAHGIEAFSNGYRLWWWKMQTFQSVLGSRTPTEDYCTDARDVLAQQHKVWQNHTAETELERKRFTVAIKIPPIC